MIGLGSGCSQQDVAQTDIDHGSGAVVPTSVVNATVKGGEMATLDVDTASLDGLRSDLQSVFGGVLANAEVIVNPTPGTLGCTPGHGHACLRFRDLSNGTVTPFNPNATAPQVNTDLVYPSPLNDSVLAVGGVLDLPVEVASQLSLYLPGTDNVRLLVKVESSHAYVGTRAGATGLWSPLLIETESPASQLRHCGDNLDDLPVIRARRWSRRPRTTAATPSRST